MKHLPTHGGSRPGAGRKPGSGQYGEPTIALRIPHSRVPTVRAFLDQCETRARVKLSLAGNEASTSGARTLSLTVPLIGRVAAGQPIMADAHVEREITLDRSLFHPRPDFLLRVQGNSMRDAGIFDRDLIAVHRTADALNGQIIVVRIDGEITVKRFRRTRERITLLPENPAFEPILVDPHTDDFAIEGLFVGAIRLP